MIAKRDIKDTLIFNDLSDSDKTFWFDFKQKKFLHNIDTFYYSVKFHNDFTDDSKDKEVIVLRNFFKRKYVELNKNGFDSSIPIDIPSLGRSLNLKPFTFARFFSICLECPEWFDIFIAPVVPHQSDGGDSVTCEMVIQIRSYMLWMYGVHEAFERSFSYVKSLCDYFKLEIDFVNENRIDYAWHTNYLSNPEKFFSPDNFYKMRVDRFKDALIHTAKVGSEDYEIDYLALGKRSDKVFIRIYLKTKEVIEKGYKPWFFKIWLFNGLINRFDLYVYEKCFEKRSWKYVDMARLEYYSEYGHDSFYVEKCKKLLNGSTTISDDTLSALANLLTPKINLVMNVEYQTMRKHTKSYELVPFRDNSAKNTCKRIYDYLDNRKIICDYLTHHTFRLVEASGDVNKCRRDYCSFWKMLRSCKMVDVHVSKKDIRLIRLYTRNLNSALIKKRAINSAVTYGIYTRGLNEDPVMQDVVETLCQMNDNDMHEAFRYKTKKIRQFNSDELAETYICNATHNYQIVNIETGEVSNSIVS